MLRKYLLVPAGIVLTLFLFSVAYAINTVDEGYQSLPAGTAMLIDAHGECRQLTNSGNMTYFVPTRSSPEWASFRDAVPGLPDLSFVDCCVAYDWTTYNTYCSASCAGVECGRIYGVWTYNQRRGFQDCTTEERTVTGAACSVPCGNCPYGYYCNNGICEMNPCSCFVAGTLVHMADGNLKSIEEIMVGEVVLGANGDVNTVVRLERPMIGNRGTWMINGEVEFTGDHPFLTSEGWKVVDIEQFTQQKEDHIRYQNINPEILQVGDVLVTMNGERVIESLEKFESRPKLELVYDLMLDGSHIYMANGYVVRDSY